MDGRRWNRSLSFWSKEKFKINCLVLFISFIGLISRGNIGEMIIGYKGRSWIHMSWKPLHHLHHVAFSPVPVSPCPYRTILLSQRHNTSLLRDVQQFMFYLMYFSLSLFLNSASSMYSEQWKMSILLCFAVVMCSNIKISGTEVYTHVYI